MKKKTLYILYVSLTVQLTAFAQNIEYKFNPPDWSYNKTIYEVNIRQYSGEGNFKGFEKHLPRLKEMGIGILWLMPIHPIGEKNRKGTLGSYYSVKDYKAVNPEYGTLEEFKLMVKLIHRMGMYVIIDWVANHTAWDNKWIEEHLDFYTEDSLGNIISPVDDWADVADLNYDNKELWAAMIDALKFWVKECDIDGYRCDVAGMLPIEFWIEARNEIEKIKPVFMLAEWDTPEMHKAFDMTYDWTMHKTMNGIAEGKKNVADIVNHLNKDEEKYPTNAFRMQFTSNHDENSWNGTVFERLGDGAETFAAFSFLIPGMPLIYTGQEAGLDKRLSFFEKDLVEWKEHKFQKLYAKLIHLKKNNDALLNGDKGGEVILIRSSEDEFVLAFTRAKNKNKIFAVFNLSDKKITANLDGESMSGSFKNFFTSQVVTFTDKESINLEPRGYKVFVK